ncbi:MAG: hypothetical protein V8S24_14130 [Gordonibacter pamelaeae]
MIDTNDISKAVHVAHVLGVEGVLAHEVAHRLLDARIRHHEVAAELLAARHHAHGPAVLHQHLVHRHAEAHVHAIAPESRQIRLHDGHAPARRVSRRARLGLPLEAAGELAGRQAVLGDAAVDEAHLAHAGMHERVGGIGVQELLERLPVERMRLLVAHALDVGDHLDDGLEVGVGHAPLEVVRELEVLPARGLDGAYLGELDAVLNTAALQQLDERALLAARDQVDAEIHREAVALRRAYAPARLVALLQERNASCRSRRAAARPQGRRCPPLSRSHRSASYTLSPPCSARPRARMAHAVAGYFLAGSA